jgi:methylmalonyl-CoA mutase N-terminal domain/subunit
VERHATALIERIDAMGGAVAAVEQGFVQEEIARSAYAAQREVEGGQSVIVGVNRYRVEDEPRVPVTQIDDSIRQLQSERLRQLRSERDDAKVQSCLAAVREAAAGTANLMPPVIAAVEGLCTLGEISDILREVFGEHA